MARAQSRQRGYDVAWDKAARRFKRDNPLCCGCLAMGIIEPAVIVDHIVPHRGDRERFWDYDNWQAVCEWHHNAVKHKLETMFERGEVTEADLRLDSAKALKVAGMTHGGVTIGMNGWPVG
jgi:5-methylcytosine-specific restriction endonuclease McrA